MKLLKEDLILSEVYFKSRISMKKIFLLLLIPGIGFSSGCIYLNPVTSTCLLSSSEAKPFCDLKDKELKLLKPVKIYDVAVDLDDKESDSVIAYGEIDKITFTDTDGKVTVKEYCKCPDHLTAGTIIKFDYDSFWLQKDYNFFIPYKIRYYARFKVINNPDISINWEFEYVWGRGLYLNRAPWENESVPESRYVGFNGKSYDGD